VRPTRRDRPDRRREGADRVVPRGVSAAVGQWLTPYSRPAICRAICSRLMALQQLRTDDLNGEPDAQTTVITINGSGVEIDLAAKSLGQLVKALDPFFAKGSPGDYQVTRVLPGRGSRTKPRPAANERGYDLGELRAWAARTGVELPQRGRIPQAIVDQYLRS
jgi:hypothetical protein